jgi:hypothetical protein
MRVMTAAALVLAWPLASCGAEDAPPAPPPQYSPQSAPRPAPAQDAPKDKEEKRGNTPPGMDRSGGGPASGAILDPTGAVTKEPVLRDR